MYSIVVANHENTFDRADEFSASLEGRLFGYCRYQHFNMNVIIHDKQVACRCGHTEISPCDIPFYEHEEPIWIKADSIENSISASVPFTLTVPITVEVNASPSANCERMSGKSVMVIVAVD